MSVGLAVVLLAEVAIAGDQCCICHTQTLDFRKLVDLYASSESNFIKGLRNMRCN